MMPVEKLPAASWQTALGLGFVSAVFDNIPLTALALKQGGYDWGFLAYAVGFGGSMIWFGSSAGVALANMYPGGEVGRALAARRLARRGRLRHRLLRACSPCSAGTPIRRTRSAPSCRRRRPLSRSCQRSSARSPRIEPPAAGNECATRAPEVVLMTLAGVRHRSSTPSRSSACVSLFFSPAAVSRVPDADVLGSSCGGNPSSWAWASILLCQHRRVRLNACVRKADVGAGRALR